MLVSNILPLFLLAILVLAQSDCNPLGVRIQYGKQLIDPKSTQKLLVSFNTISQCPDSFLKILSYKGFKYIPCSSNKVAASGAMNNFTTYIQRCQLQSQIFYGQRFYYNVFGFTVSQGTDPVQGLDQMVQINAIDPANALDPTSILVLADWGVIKTTGFTPISQSLRNVMQTRSFNLMMVNGDIAYNLDSSNGITYTQFLNMAEEFISKIPVVIVPGNHENYSEDDQLLLNQTFLMYGVVDNLVSGFTFGDLYILPFDPYRFLYFKNSTIDSLVALTSQLDIAKQTGLFIIPFSHYPLICSGESSNCLSILANMRKYFAAMLDAGVSLYIGAHSHEYERIYPYNQNQTFSKVESPYYSDGGYLVSIVEGAGGSETDLVEQMPIVQDYTAVYNIGETGFGILTANKDNKVSWTHYSTGQKAFVDSMQIIKVQGKQEEKLFKHLLSQ